MVNSAHKTLFNMLTNQKTKIKFLPTTKKIKHKWTLYEEQIVLEMYIDYFIKQHKNMKNNDFIYAIAGKCPDIPFNSIKMKTQNIKQLCIDFNVADSFIISPLKNYSQTSKMLFINLLKKNNIIG